MIGFEWDPKKAKSNERKHKVSFEEAMSVFLDDDARIQDDPDHSIREDHFVLLGMSDTARVLTVVHCYRQSDTVIRIISARKATRRERAIYGGYKNA